jgi:ferredoxin
VFVELDFINDKDLNILDGLENLLIPVKSQCRMGICGICKCKANLPLNNTSSKIVKLEEDEFLPCVTSKSLLKTSGIATIKVINLYEF